MTWTAVPILRIFDEAKAREFYCDFLGFVVDWEHRFEPGLPLYLQVSREGLRLHLSEHHGDTTPGTRVYVEIADAAGLQAELAAKQYGYGRPGLERVDWGLEVQVVDPFGNRLTFTEPRPAS